MNYNKLADLILEEVGGFKPVKLPYALDALEPYIDAETLNLHFNKAGGAYNHQLFWFMMSPDRKTISGEIKDLIEKQYKSFDKFKEKFVEEALAHFGSGWLWLVKKGNKLEMISTDNQNNPLMDSDVNILLGIDVWEHAYYKKYGPNREKYIKQFLKIVNWDYCNQQLMQ